ncbi:hypothetical protein FSARC_13843 [Fusarium sarcochroum]|uniref:JmjC domain-containing protein n=1 Tax=Fusarium sarcochroum TaxID=1208366 RepID=A0A8H4WSA4_9HYPO|nr:hypothetical protein FSARC_13843 [Fusarium sarcochroum]
MARRSPSISDVNSLHQKVDGLMEKLLIIERSIHSKANSQRQTTGAKRRGKGRNQNEDVASPWVEPLMSLFIELKEYAQLLRSHVHAITSPRIESSLDIESESQELIDEQEIRLVATNENSISNIRHGPEESGFPNQAQTPSRAVPIDERHDREPRTRTSIVVQSEGTQRRNSGEGDGGDPHCNSRATADNIFGHSNDKEVLDEEATLIDGCTKTQVSPAVSQEKEDGIADASLSHKRPKRLGPSFGTCGEVERDGNSSMPLEHETGTGTDTTAANSTDFASAPSVFTLTATEMGEALISNLEKIVNRDDFRNEILVSRPAIDLSMFEAGLDVNTDDCQYVALKYASGPENEGFSYVHVSEHKSHFRWPNFADQVDVPTIEEAQTWLNNVITRPPDHTIPYYCGHAFGVPFQSPLNPGREILDDANLKDIHHPYFHIGGDKSAARFHWEDLSCIDSTGGRHGLRSANLVLAGVKIWILIAIHHTAKFRAFIDTNWPVDPCDYGVSHQNLLISPSRLRNEEIDFSIHIGCPGKLIVTHQCQYHLVVNMGPCIAQSINFKLVGDSLTCSEQVRCPKDGLSGYAEHHGAPIASLSRSLEGRRHTSVRSSPRKKLPSETRQAHLKASTGPETSQSRKRKNVNNRTDWHGSASGHETRRTKQRRVNDVVSPTPKSIEDFQQLAKAFETERLVVRTPALDKAQLPSARVFRFVCAILSRETLQMFSSIVESWNKRNQIFEPASRGQESPIERRATLLQTCVRGSGLMKYLCRHHQLHLIKEVDIHRKGRLRSDSTFKNELLNRTGLTSKNYEYHMAKGKKWRALCAISQGLLPYVPLSSNSFGINIQEVCFDEQELVDIRRLLDNDYARTLFRAGLAFQQAVEASRRVTLAWEGSVIDWGSLDETEVMSYFQIAEDNPAD